MHFHRRDIERVGDVMTSHPFLFNPYLRRIMECHKLTLSVEKNNWVFRLKIQVQNPDVLVEKKENLKIFLNQCSLIANIFFFPSLLFLPLLPKILRGSKGLLLG